MTTESKISLECLRGDHQERCLSQDHCSCKCDDPVGLDVDTDEVIKDQIEAVILLNFSAITTIIKINTKIRINEVNEISNNRLKSISVIYFSPITYTK